MTVDVPCGRPGWDNRITTTETICFSTYSGQKHPVYRADPGYPPLPALTLPAVTPVDTIRQTFPSTEKFKGGHELDSGPIIRSTYSYSIFFCGNDIIEFVYFIWFLYSHVAQIGTKTVLGLQWSVGSDCPVGMSHMIIIVNDQNLKARY